MKFYKKIIKNVFVYMVISLMLLLVIMVDSSLVSSVYDVETINVGDPNGSSNDLATRGSRGNTIAGYLQLWDPDNSEAHNGVYEFYSYSTRIFPHSSNTLRIYIRNIYGESIYDINTQISIGSGTGDVVKITNNRYNRSYISSNYYEYFQYYLTINHVAEIKAYSLSLYVEFTIGQGDSATELSGTMNLKVQLSSRVKSSGEEDLKLINTDSSTYGEIYSGAKNQVIGLSNIYSASGTLDDVKFTLDFPSNFEIKNNKATITELETYYYYNDMPTWTLDSAGSVSAQPEEFFGTVDISYKYNDKTVFEGNVPVAIEIAETPILSVNDQLKPSEIGKESGGVLLSNFEIFQGTTNQHFSIMFRNNGNVDLKDVEVELFTDNAAYFFKTNFYYDENYQAFKRAYGNTIEVGDLSIGSSINCEFPTEVIKNLPPGLYRIPVKYDAKYSMDELADVNFDVQDYHEDITSARSTTNEGYTPFILVNVLEGDDAFDEVEPDLSAITSESFRTGLHNVQLTVELTNLENYQLNNMNAEISVGGTSPFQQLNDPDGSPTRIDAQEMDFNMYAANDPVFSNKYTIHFVVDVANYAEPGLHQVPITITCLDPFNVERITKVNLDVNINPVPPNFVISGISTNDIEPNEDFTLKVKVYNCGGCNAEKVRIMFNGSSNLFFAEKSTCGPKSIGKYEEAEFEFKIKAGDVEPGKIYASSLYISYEDPLGNVYPFDSNSQRPISLQVKKPKQWTEVDEGFALVILGLFILISAVLIGVARSRTQRKGRYSEESSVKDDRSKPEKDDTTPKKKSGRFGGLFRKKQKPLDYSGGPDDKKSYTQTPAPQQPVNSAPPTSAPPYTQPRPAPTSPTQPGAMPQYQYQQQQRYPPQQSPGWQAQPQAQRQPHGSAPQQQYQQPYSGRQYQQSQRQRQNY